MTDTVRWFDEYPRCRCGKRAAGVLRGTGNESYGAYCESCAKQRLAAAEKARGIPKTCHSCGTKFTGKRADAVFCSSYCRVVAARKRRRS